MNKSKAIELLRKENWTKADAERALANVDFSTDPDELAIRRVTSLFSGSELLNRQRLQAAQKGLVTKKIKEIQQYQTEIKRYQAQNSLPIVSNQDALPAKLQTLTKTNQELAKANQILKKDNKDLKNIVDRIKLQLSLDTKKLLQYQDSEIRKQLVKLFKWTLG